MSGAISNSTSMPGDITIGEVWRGQEDLKQDLRRTTGEIRDELTALPGRIAHEIDARTLERLGSLRSEMLAGDKAVMESLEGKLKVVKDRLKVVQSIVFGMVTIIVVAFMGVLINVAFNTRG